MQQPLWTLTKIINKPQKILWDSPFRLHFYVLNVKLAFIKPSMRCVCINNKSCYGFWKFYYFVYNLKIVRALLHAMEYKSWFANVEFFTLKYFKHFLSKRTALHNTSTRNKEFIAIKIWKYSPGFYPKAINKI